MMDAQQKIVRLEQLIARAETDDQFIAAVHAHSSAYIAYELNIIRKELTEIKDIIYQAF